MLRMVTTTSTVAVEEVAPGRVTFARTKVTVEEMPETSQEFADMIKSQVDEALAKAKLPKLNMDDIPF